MPKLKFTFLFFGISLVILLLPLLFIQDGPNWCDFSSKGEIGDVIGGTTAPFVAIGAAYVTFLAFWVQYEYNIKQHKDIMLQRFEHNFYEMISSHENITSELVIELLDPNKEPYDESIIFRQKGRDVFQCLYEMYPIPVRIFEKHQDLYRDIEYTGLRELFNKDDDAIKYYSINPIVGMLDHYFRHLYWIFKYIKEAESLNDEDKYKYACIVRSGLSQYELVLLFYNGLSDNGRERFKPLIEDFSLLNNLRLDLLSKDEEKELYQRKLRNDYPFEQNEMIMPREYKKSAFVHKQS